MKLTLLGTGCPSVDFKRCGSSNLISTNSTKILVDCGSGVTQRLNQSKNSSADIDALLLTHLHTDHVIDLYQLIISSWHSDRTSQWKIYGPKGTKQFVDKIFLTWKSERKLRISYERRKSSKALNYKVYEFKKEGFININDIKIKYFEVDHKPVPYAYGFSFFSGKKKKTISGDTRPCES
jgi:Metal-dependent hydrolases of the beta-lactamase superfamily III